MHGGTLAGRAWDVNAFPHRAVRLHDGILLKVEPSLRSRSIPILLVRVEMRSWKAIAIQDAFEMLGTSDDQNWPSSESQGGKTSPKPDLG